LTSSAFALRVPGLRLRSETDSISDAPFPVSMALAASAVLVAISTKQMVTTRRRPLQLLCSLEPHKFAGKLRMKCFDRGLIIEEARWHCQLWHYRTASNRENYSFAAGVHHTNRKKFRLCPFFVSNVIDRDYLE